MNINKKLDRMKQWAGERMGGEIKTSVSDDFKALETEMTLRHEGLERLQRSMNGYVKAISKRNEGDDKEKTLPIGYMGTTMVSHGEDFENDSEFGQCLILFGRTNERVARIQENYVTDATATWLESLERSVAQMKEYQVARKKLEQRRLAYDTSLAKMQKAKKEDFRVEEELRSQKAKYEEASDDVYRRMQDIKESEVESVVDLGAFLDAELAYYDRARDALLELKSSWPANSQSKMNQNGRRINRSRSNTAHSFSDRLADPEPPPSPEPPRPSIKSHRTVSNYSTTSEPRPTYNRSTTFEGPAQLHQQRQRDFSPSPSTQRLTRIPSESLSVRTALARPQSRVASSTLAEHDVFNDNHYNSDFTNSPDRSYGERSVSPATSHGSFATGSGFPTSKKGPPPPPPSRAKKPPPPPPPAKRAGV